MDHGLGAGYRRKALKTEVNDLCLDVGAQLNVDLKRRTEMGSGAAGAHGYFWKP